jgi:ribosomal-protein-alanine N-acetyltransferase
VTASASAHAGIEVRELDVRVQLMRRRHLRSVLRVDHEVCPRPWTLALFLSELAAGPSRHYVVARAGTAVVGYGGLMVSVGEGHITTLAVDPPWQRRSVGTRLLLALASYGVDEGCTGLTLEVRMGNVAAQALYRRFGFVPAGVRRGYYAETKEDALIMWAHDLDTPAYLRRLATIAEHLPAPSGHGPS